MADDFDPIAAFAPLPDAVTWPPPEWAAQPAPAPAPEPLQWPPPGWDDLPVAPTPEPLPLSALETAPVAPVTPPWVELDGTPPVPEGLAPGAVSPPEPVDLSGLAAQPVAYPPPAWTGDQASAPASTLAPIDPYAARPPELEQAAPADAPIQLTPEEQQIQDAEDTARREQLRADLAAARQLEEIQRNNEAAQANADAARQAQAAAAAQLAEVDADIARLGRTKIDPERYTRNRSTFQTIASVLAAGAQGFLRPGERNGVLDQINAAIDRDIQAQVADLGTQRAAAGDRRGIVADLYDRSKDAYRASETARIAYLGTVDQQLAAEAAKFDPLGTTAQRIREARQGVQAQQAAARARLEQAQFDRELKLLAARKTNAEIGKLEAETAKLNRRGTGTPRSFGGPNVRDPRVVYAPGTDTPLVSFGSGDTKGPAYKESVERAEGVRKVLAGTGATLRDLNKLEAMFEDYGRKGLFDGVGFRQSEEYARLEAQRKLAGAAISQIIARGFAPSETDAKKAMELVAEPTSTWAKANTALAKIRQVRTGSEETIRDQLSPWVDTATQENIIKSLRTYGVSKRDAEETEASKASQLIGDTSQPAERRVSAVANLVATERKKADEAGDEDSWIYTTYPALIEKLGELKAIDPAAKAIRKELLRIRKTASDRATSTRNRFFDPTGRARGPASVAEQTEAALERDTRAVSTINDALGED